MAKRSLAQGQCLQDRIETDLLLIRNASALVRFFFKAPDVAGRKFIYR
jgi:hypothetical protein